MELKAEKSKGYCNKSGIKNFTFQSGILKTEIFLYSLFYHLE